MWVALVVVVVLVIPAAVLHLLVRRVGIVSDPVAVRAVVEDAVAGIKKSLHFFCESVWQKNSNQTNAGCGAGLTSTATSSVCSPPPTMKPLIGLTSP